MLDPNFSRRRPSDFLGVCLGDKRLDDRFELSMQRLAASPGERFSKAMTDAELQGFLGLLRNERVSFSQLLEPHYRATAQRAASVPGPIYVAHDPTDLVFRADGVRPDFHAHASLAVSQDRFPLGLLNLRPRRGLANPEKASARWRVGVEAAEARGPRQLRARLIHLMDRESDDYSLFCWLAHRQSRHILRLFRERHICLGAEGKTAFKQHLQKAQAVGIRQVRLGRRGSGRPASQQKIHPPREEREARLSVSASRVVLCRPKHASRELPEQLAVNVVRVWEEQPPAGAQPVSWLLLTSEPIGTEEELWAVVDGYRLRWVVEEYFKALKTGCGYEKRQWETVRARLNGLAMLSVVAWQVLQVRSLGRSPETAGRRAREVFNEVELKVLRAEAKRKRNVELPAEPTLREALLAVAALGGHFRWSGEPGWQTLGEGMEELFTLCRGWYMARADEDVT